MTIGWIQQPERGSRLSLNLMTWLCLRAGWRVGRALMVPVTGYFFLASARARAASRAYLARALGRPARLGDVFRHFLTFGAVVLDRPFFLTRSVGDYELSVSGLEHFEPGRGCILLGSHLGSFEVLRALAEANPRVRVHALMHEGPAASTALFRQLNPEVARKIIPIGSPGAMLRVKEALAAGGMVGILGDRVVGGDKVARVDFLGAPASFPLGPFALADLLAVPVVLCFGIHLGGRRYEIRFEPFMDGGRLPRAGRDAALRALVARYAARLEEQCRRHPYNWFNFYDFWEQGVS
jgi:predicted LPLAT superfamily acyltransferase